jgi:hypothetical protein
MGTELVFSGGHRVRVSGGNAESLIQSLNRAFKREEIRSLSSGAQLAPGWLPVQTESEGEILVNPGEVAYVRDLPDQEPVLDQAL